VAAFGGLYLVVLVGLFSIMEELFGFFRMTRFAVLAGQLRQTPKTEDA
jgi:hypothetical protein